MNTWIYLGLALLVTGVTAVALTAIAVTGSGKGHVDRLFPMPRWARAKGVTTAALGGVEAVELVSRSGSHKPVSRRPAKVSERPQREAEP